MHFGMGTSCILAVKYMRAGGTDVLDQIALLDKFGRSAGR
jgi:hypothetical protein